MERLALWAAIGLSRLLSLLPLDLVRRLGAGYGNVVWWLKARPARITRINLALCFPEMSQAERDALARRSLQETAKLVSDSGLIWYWSRERWLATCREVSGEPLIRDSLAAGRGVLLLVPHFGNWEVLSLYLGRYPFTGLYDPPRISSLEAPIREARSREGTTLLPIDRAGLKAVYRALDHGEMVALLPDQVPERPSGVHAPFFGMPALTMTFAHRLIKKTHPLVLLAAVRRVTGGFALEFSTVDEKIHSADPVVSATAMNAAIEALVKTDLAQYQWEYKRFKKQPEGVPKVYRNLAAPIGRGEEDD